MIGQRLEVPQLCNAHMIVLIDLDKVAVHSTGANVSSIHRMKLFLFCYINVIVSCHDQLYLEQIYIAIYRLKQAKTKNTEVAYR